MDLTEKYQTRCSRFWSDVEKFFGTLPAQLFRQGVLLRTNMAVSLSDTGEFRDILRRDRDCPLPYLHLWLLDDWHYPQSPQRDALEKQLFLAMIFASAAVYAQTRIQDKHVGSDQHFLWLERALSRQSHFHLTRLYPGRSPFWDYHRAFWQEYAAAMMAPPPVRAKVKPLPGAESSGGDLILEAELFPIAERRAFSKIPVVATALSTGREASVGQLCSLMDRVNLVLQILHDIFTLRRDLMRRAYSYPIIRTLIAAGLDPHQPYIPEQVLGASVLTGSIQMICQESLATLGACRGIAEALGLPTFQAYLANVEDVIGEVKALFSLKAGPRTDRLSKPKPTRQKLSFAPHFDHLTRALDMAEKYLLSDLTFRESWDIQRGQQPQMPELVGSAFPSGLIVELLCRHGHNLTQQVSQVYATLRGNNFRYYDFSLLPPDADDLGLLLRLFRYSAPQQKPVHRQIVETPLRWMKQSILPSGQIPVWLKQAGIDNVARQESSILIWGNSCSSTEANLLLGLAEHDWSGYGHIIERSALSLMHRIRQSGLGANLYYVAPYSLWITLKLLALLGTKPVQQPLVDEANHSFDMLLKRLGHETKKQGITPQDAALLTLTCFISDPGHRLRPHFDERWITILLKSQRHDGSWDDEPLFLVPDRDGTAWYASHSVTTAFCYHALKTYATAG